MRHVTGEAWRRLCGCPGRAWAWLAPLAAHHVISAKFDSAKTLTLRGPITAVDWANPHAHVFINVAGRDGRIANWAIELESPVDLRRQGWTANTVTIGDVVTVEGIAARDGSSQAWSLSMVLARTGQRVFFARPMAPPAATHKPTPRWPDSQPRLGAPPRRNRVLGDPKRDDARRARRDRRGGRERPADQPRRRGARRAVPDLGARSLRLPAAGLPQRRSDVPALPAARADRASSRTASGCSSWSSAIGRGCS